MRWVSFVIMTLLFYNPLYNVAEKVIIEQQRYWRPAPLILRFTGLETMLIILHLIVYSVGIWLAIYVVLLFIQSFNQPKNLKHNPLYDLAEVSVAGQEILGGKRFYYARKPAFLIGFATLLARLINLYLYVFIALAILWNVILFFAAANRFLSNEGFLSVALPAIYNVLDPGPLAQYTEVFGAGIIGALAAKLPAHPLIPISPTLLALAFLVPRAERWWQQERRERYWIDLKNSLYCIKYNQQTIEIL